MMSQHPPFARSRRRSSGLNSFLEDPPRPAEHGLHSGGISLAASGHLALSDLGDLQSNDTLITSSHAHDAFMATSHQQQNPLVQWYTSQQGPWDPIHGRIPSPQGPWNSIHGNAPSAFPAEGVLNTRPSGPSFFAYRSHALRSEGGTTAPGHPPSDSGYGSLRRQSVVDGSLYGDLDQSGDTASVTSHLAGIQVDRPVNPPLEGWSQQIPAQNQVIVPAVAKSRECKYCHAMVKTKSELRKHEQRHTKPYHCNVSGCPWNRGFSTSNDVERHIKSCHPDLGGKGHYFKCPEARCKSKDKKWPRSDNFKQHLRKIHHYKRVDDVEKYVWKPQLFPGPDLAELASVGQGLSPPDVNHNNGNNTSSWNFNMHSTQQESLGDPCGLNDYIDQQMAYPREALTHQQQQQQQQQQHLEMMSCVGGHVPTSSMQMSPMGLHTGASLAPSEQARVNPQSPQDLAVSSRGAQETKFEEWGFYHNASNPDIELEEDDQSVIHYASELASLPSRDLCEESKTLEPSVDRDCDESSDADGDPEDPSPHSVFTLDDDDSSSTLSKTVSKTHDSSGSGGDEAALVSTGTAATSDPQSCGSPHSIPDFTTDQNRAIELIKALRDQGMLPDLLKRIEYPVSKEEETRPKSIVPLGRDGQKTMHACGEPGCHKSFPRLCELKKHQKRHAKPYGCTIPQCGKRFGSKNDWMRHENSQHYQLELWKCDEKSSFDTVEPCNRQFNRREQFKTHLFKDHGITKSAEMEHKLEDCHDERNYEVKFWCGFCKVVVQVKDKGHKAWLARFNHIDNHFSKQMDISEWKSPDPDLQEVDIVLMATNDSSHGESQFTATALSARPEKDGRPPKRGANGGVQRPRPRKKARPSALWYCCGCRGQQLVGFSAACLTPACRGHEQCDECESEDIPLDGGEHDL